ncbi:MAG: hypothetical protein R3254_02165, partial [Thiomicrorhabdus sp.]|nr:hypothetical protein [Thiomicrorhabdus sp.]
MSCLLPSRSLLLAAFLFWQNLLKHSIRELLVHLDRYLSKYAGLSRKSILRLLTLGQISVNGQVATARCQEVNQFSEILIDNRPLAQTKPARYFMMHKPAGILSATTDAQHTTAVQLI